MLAPLALPPQAAQQPQPAQDAQPQRNSIHTPWQHARFDQAPPPNGVHAQGILQDAQTPASTPTHATQPGMSHPALGGSTGTNKLAAQLLKERILGMLALAARACCRRGDPPMHRIIMLLKMDRVTK